MTAQYVTSATRVFSNGVPLLLIDSQAICAPTGTPLIAGGDADSGVGDVVHGQCRFSISLR